MKISCIINAHVILFLLSIIPLNGISIPPNWTPAENLQFNMNIIGVLQMPDGSVSINDNDIIAGFVDDECRGVISPLAAQNGLFFLTIGSNQMFGETISFKAYLSDSDMIVDLDQNMTFVNLSVVGTLADPYVFNFTQDILHVLTLNANPPEGGFVSGSGYYNYQEEVEISATSNTGWTFMGWTGDNYYIDDPTSPIATVTMPDYDITFTANFVEDDIISPPDWIPVENLQFNMNIIGVLQMPDGSVSINDNDIIAGFVDDECRGVISPLAAQNGLFFLTIGSNQMFGETITFKAYLSDQNIIVDLDQEIIFENLSVLGTLAEPFVFTFGEIEDYLFLRNINIEHGYSKCFNAKKTITVAGENSFFKVQSGGEAKLIAGESIIFLPGTVVKSGGYLHAYIDDVFCDDLRPINKLSEDVVRIDHLETYKFQDGQLFRVYPNPTYGLFTLELTTHESEQNFKMEIFGLFGNLIKHQELNHQKQHTISLIDQKPGMYIVRLTVGDRVGIERLIKR